MPQAPLSLRQNPLAGEDYTKYDPKEVTLGDLGTTNSEKKQRPSGKVIKIENDDGSVTISIGGPEIADKSGDDDDFNENLARKIDSSALGAIGSELARLIRQDNESRQEWLQQYVTGLELLGTKIERPQSNATDGSTAVEGQSTVRSPLLLESVVRFQANARGELLPADGPVRVRNDGLGSLVADIEMQALETDMNHYLTVTAVEYYPDTERMHFSLGFGGTAFKKVYHCPIRRRPVSEFERGATKPKGKAETTLENAQRVTHVIRMSPSTVKRMQLLGVYRNISLSMTQPPEMNVVDEKIQMMQGIKPNTTTSIDNEDREIYECYCELDLPGYEHEDDDGPTGLKLPYRVTMDKVSHEVLEIRRWWRKEDPNYLRKGVFVNYTFIPGFGFYGLGLLHLVGNTAMALTAGWRLCIDNGMFANFPGFIYAKQAGRQLTNEFRVPPGGGVPIETGGQPIQNVISQLPYRGVDGAFMQLLENVEQGGQRLAGTAELQVGDGNTEAPVGTTIALIEQATKVLSAVHKRMHQAQSREFQLLKELFKEDPTSFWKDNKFPAHTWTEDTLVSALENVNFVPVADPNTPSQSARIQKAMALKQMQTANPALYNAKAIDERILNMLGIEDAQSLFAPPAPPAPDPRMITAQAKMVDAQSKQEEVKVRAVDAMADAQNRAADRESKERIATLQLAREIAVHPESASTAEHFLGSEHMPAPTG